jgi:hypothetical protein
MRIKAVVTRLSKLPDKFPEDHIEGQDEKTNALDIHKFVW